jgi:tRNA-2-methylthio-N6-dimethylallyladenosine synthase
MEVKRYYIETYGCQMNEYDSELVSGILDSCSCQKTNLPEDADIILVNSCSVRDKAEQRAIARLSQFKNYRKKNPRLILGLLGCVAQRQKSQIISENPFIDIVFGPDSYRRLPEILNGYSLPMVSVAFSKGELYDDVFPSRNNKVNAWIPIMRGCNKFCSYCIVPYTRGRERSRPVESVIREIKSAVDEGFKEVTLLGQNVNSYHYENYTFSDLLEMVSDVSGVRRVRFMSPHPEDMDIKILELMRERENICNHIHLPLQSGSSHILDLMNRTYNQAKYLSVVEKIKKIVPDSSITTDIIVGFPGETEEDFQETLRVMDKVMFDTAFMFKYSPRPGTKAAQMNDDIPDKIKSGRLPKVIEKQKTHTLIRNKNLLDSVCEVLVDGTSKKNPKEKMGRTDTNKVVIIKEGDPEIGEIVKVKINGIGANSLFGKLI